MKYSDVISLIDKEVRDQEAWPLPGSATQEQINRTHAAVLAVASQTPIQRLVPVVSTLTPTGDTLKKAPLPATLFTLRADLGVELFEFDTAIYKTIERAVTFEMVQSAGLNYFQQENLLFSIDARSLNIWYTGATTVKVTHVPYPVKPTTGNYTTTDVPLNGTDIEQVVQIVTAHVNGVTIKDPASSQFAIILKQLYQGRVD